MALIELGLNFSTGNEFSYFIGTDCNNLIPYNGNPTTQNPLIVDLTDYGWVSGDFCYKICEEDTGCCCEETGTIDLNKYFTTRCCVPGGGVMAAPYPGTYLADDGNCYQTLSPTTDTHTLVAVSDIGDCGNCTGPGCSSASNTPTPSVTNSITPTPTTDETPTTTPTNTTTPSVTPTVTNSITPTPSITPTITNSITPTPSEPSVIEYDYFNNMSLCCDSTDDPIVGIVGLNADLGLTTGDYVVVNGDAYQLGSSTTTEGNTYSNVQGPYNDCDAAVSNATNPCRYDMLPCCDDESTVSYYPPFTWETNQIIENGLTYLTSQFTSGNVDQCMSVNDYTGQYSVNTQYPAVMEYNAEGCINRCSRCVFAVQPCGWPSNTYILWIVDTDPNIVTGSVWYDSGLNSWITQNAPPTFPSTNCLTVLDGPQGGLVSSIPHTGYNNTVNDVDECQDSECIIATFDVGNNGASAYVINGENNPTLTLYRNSTYVFDINSTGHPFYIKTRLSTGSDNQYNDGVSGNGTQVGNITFVVEQDVPDTLYYQCSVHYGMNGIINVEDWSQS